jgi:electron transfer flavoprotein beta subunit
VKIAVMVKQVPDSKLIEIDENGNLRRDGVPTMIDPFGFYALRFAVRMKKVLGGTVTAITMGPNQAVEALRRCLEYGADDAILLSDRAFAGSDTFATSRTLAQSIVGCDYDYVICGMQATDGDTGQIPAELSVMLGYQLVSYAVDFEFKDDRLIVQQSYGDSSRKVIAPKGTVISVLRDASNDRPFPNIREHVATKDKPVITKDRVALNLGVFSTGMKGSFTKVVRTATPMPVKKDAMMIDGSDSAKGAEELLKEVRL